MTRYQWLILGLLVFCLIACAGVFGFLMGAYIFPQRSNPVTALNPTSVLEENAPSLQQSAILGDWVLKGRFVKFCVKARAESWVTLV